MVYVIFTIREGSKRISNKAFIECNGKPLLSWIFNECKKSQYIDRIYISTSGKNYIKKLQDEKWECEILERPESLSGDDVPILPVIKNALDIITAKKKINENRIIENDCIMWLDFSKPFMTINKIDTAIEIMDKLEYDSIFTVKRFKGLLLGDPPITTANAPIRYQYFSQFRLWKCNALRNVNINSWGQGKKHLDLPIVEDWAIDINDPTDLICAEALLKAGYR